MGYSPMEMVLDERNMSTTMEPTPRGTLPVELLTAILPGLPLKTLATFKCVSKPWKALIESPYFGRLFVSLHKDLSTSWSLMVPNAHLEAFGFHGCELWNISKSPGSYLTPHPTNLPTFYRASSHGLVLVEIGYDSPKSFVGNPVLRNWVEIPQPPEPCKFTGLVTRVKEKGQVSNFKVVRSCESRGSDNKEWRVCVYSSELGLWSTKRLTSLRSICNPSDCDAMSFNGMLYLLEATEPDVLIAYDFYGGGDDGTCLVIPLPPADYAHIRTSKATFGGHAHLRRCLTSSQGQVFFLELVGRRLIVWRLKDYIWEMKSCGHIVSVGFMNQCFPLAMNPFNSEVIYFWSLQHSCFVSGNMWGQRVIVHQDSENWNWRSDNEGCCRVNTCESKGYMQSVFDADKTLVLSQFVLPPWMDSVPTIRPN